MDIRQCRNCRKLFQYRGQPLCPVCVDEQEKLFDKVRDYIYDNPRSNIEEICGETGADSATIYKWLREGRLILSMDNAALLACESCGDSIRSGRFCKKCTGDMKNRLESVAKTIAPKSDKKVKNYNAASIAKMHGDFGKK